MENLSSKKSPIDYVMENGDYDVETPRHYVAKPLSKTKKILSLSFNKKALIQEFDVNNGNVKIIMQSGHSIESPLSELELIIKDNPKGEGPSTYIVKHGDNKIRFIFNYWSFDELEIQDMFNILIRAGKVSEPQAYKILKWVFRILGFIQEIVSDGPSLGDMAKDTLTSDGKIEVLGNSPLVKTNPEKSKSNKSKWIWIITGIILILFVAFLIIGIIFDDENETIIDDFTQNEKAYLLGETNDMLFLIALDMNENLSLKNDTAYAYIATPTPLWLNDSYLMLKVIEEKSGEYLFYGYTPTEDWGIKSMIIKSEVNNDNKILFKGELEDSNGAIENVNFVIIQPKESDSYYIGNIGEDPAFLSLSFVNNDALKGHLYYNYQWYNLECNLKGYNEYSEPVFEIVGFTDEMKLIPWSNGGEQGIGGYVLMNGEENMINLEDISSYYLF